MKKKLGISLIILGAVLLAAALSLVIYNKVQDYRYGKAAKEVLSGLEEVIPNIGGNRTDDAGGSQTGGSVLPGPVISPSGILGEYEIQEEEETTVEYDGISYLGVVYIPSMDRELPVTAEYVYTNMRFAACRYSGKVSTGDLIICAHNNNTFFRGIANLNTGDSIIFTDASGNIFYYEVIAIDTINGYDIERMKSGSEEWDITLFSCTYGGASRVTVRAVLAE